MDSWWLLFEKNRGRQKLYSHAGTRCCASFVLYLFCFFFGGDESRALLFVTPPVCVPYTGLGL